MSYGFGARVYLHPFKTAHDVTQNGLSVSAGEQTLLGITMVSEQTLLGITMVSEQKSPKPITVTKNHSMLCM